ncbi:MULTISPECIES: gliding motility-associated C-terminal domain-containing protein [Flavobacteriaceae]|uniref:gliding motility-associated C-terminal domain-containing protein n=1 Tax=Flavobacteriaceae TaxID=49546 RepID=UPI001492CD89|nr:MULTISPECIES: gliding motility-associated C-terminal domain-containing protein [Allomuricauda]MDC6365992.1 gliding motility-associated C-terminal domain-containing protein [Muricauda sp. AC10]
MKTISLHTKSYKSFLLLFITIANSTIAQEAIHNFGNLQFHESAQVGFHLNLINDGIFDKNAGLTGFYSNGQLTVSGSSTPIFSDIEIMIENNLFLETPIGVSSNANFILGNVETNKNSSNNYLDFINDAFYFGAENTSHVNGYAAASNKELITFPIGDGTRLRSLTITSNLANKIAKSAYFNENPNYPSSLAQNFYTSEKADENLQISAIEFWRLESGQPSAVTLTWNTESYIELLADAIPNLVVTGWSKTKKQWESLGNMAITGNIEKGSITSEIFVPNDYEIITLGGNKDTLEPFIVKSENYLLTPNNDGINDVLVIDALENKPDNLLNIYNRHGLLVYSKLNYFDEFNGRSNRKIVLNRSSGLPSGVYFYLASVNATKERFQGYIYIDN